MSDRWKRWTEPLDEGGPGQDVWARAQRAPAHPEVSDERAQSPTNRLAAGVTALVVSVLAFALVRNAFGPGEVAPVGETGQDQFVGTMLWPERTEADLAAAQAAVDAGDTGVSWRLDPEQVAVRFAQDVLGWPAPEGRWAVQLQTLTGIQQDTPVFATLSWLAVPCPSPPPGENPFVCPPPRLDQQVELVQPQRKGADGAWVVRSATSETLVTQGELTWGDTLPADATVGGVATLPAGWTSEPDGYRAAVGVQVGEGDGCDASVSVELALASARKLALPTAQIGSPCSPVAPAYVWVAATTAMQLIPETGDVVPLEDPILAGGEPLPLLGLTAVPFAVTIPDETSTESAASPSTSSSLSSSDTSTPLPSPSTIQTQSTATLPTFVVTAENENSSPSLVGEFEGERILLFSTESGAATVEPFTLLTGTQLVFRGDATEVAIGWSEGSGDVYDRPVEVSDQPPVTVHGLDGQQLVLRLHFTWGGGADAEASIPFEIEVPPAEDLSLACDQQDRVAFDGPTGGVLMPGSDLFIRANVIGVEPSDSVAQITWPDGNGSWNGKWAIYRDGTLIAFVGYEGLSGTACRGTGVEGV